MIRYMLPKDTKHLFENDMRTHIPLPREGLRFVNILEETEDAYKVKAYLQDGNVVVGWVGKIFYPPFELFNQDELYDGRFNV